MKVVSYLIGASESTFEREDRWLDLPVRIRLPLNKKNMQETAVEEVINENFLTTEWRIEQESIRFVNDAKHVSDKIDIGPHRSQILLRGRR